MGPIVLLIAASVLGLSHGFAAPPPGRAEQSPATVLVDKPQAALMWDKNDVAAKIWLVRMTNKELSFKASVASRNVQKQSADQKKIEGVYLVGTGETFKVNPATNEFAKFDTLKRTFAGETAGQGAPELESLTEEAEGSGTTGDEAIRDALRNVVRKAVGVIVDGEVIVKNEDVISNKVLTYSNGFVSSYEELGREETDGLIRVKIRATVEQRKLLADLRKAGVSVGALDGKDLVASAQTRKDALDAAASLLNKALTDLPNVLRVDVRPFTTLDYDAETQVLNLLVEVRVDRKKYLAYADSLAALLKRISVAHTSVLQRTLPSLGRGDNLLDLSQAPLGPVIRFGPDLRGNPKTWCLWLLMGMDDRQRTFRLALSAVDADVTRALKGTRGKLRVEIDLLDSNGEEIAEDVFDPLAGMKRRSFWLGWISARPRQQVVEYPQEAAEDLLGPASLSSLSREIDGDKSVNVYVFPECVAGLEKGNVLFARGVECARAIKIAPDVLRKVKEVRPKIVFTSVENTKTSN